MVKKTTKLSVVKPNQSRTKSYQEMEEETKSWRITRQEAVKRVRSLRVELESYHDQIDAVPFDILNDGIPAPLDYSKRKWAVSVMEEFNPLIKGLFDRCDEAAQRHGVGEEMDFNAQLFDLKMHTAETGFQIGLLAGALFAGAPKETVDRFERGLLYTIHTDPRIVKD
jgi:hypothetical protein